MTIKEAINNVIDFAKSRLGYLEKSRAAYDKDPKIVYELIEGAGNDNYAECWEDIRKSFQGQPWCCCWIYWIFVKTFGEETAQRLLYVSDWTADDTWRNFYCPNWVQNWENHNARYQSSQAQIGDVIYFTKSHTGLVYDISDKYVYTIEGNTSVKKNLNGTDAVIPNGGGVALKKYIRGESSIWCYGRPNWSVIGSQPKPDSKPTIYKGYKDSEQGGSYCQELQTDLNKLGVTDDEEKILAVDGSCGGRTEAAIKKFQSSNNLEVDGRCGPKTWAAIDSCIKDIQQVVIRTQANCRKGPGKEFEVIKVLKAGEIHPYSKVENNWFYLSDVQGWVSNRVVKTV